MPTLPAVESTLHYQDSGSGTPLVFLHGNPTSCYLWRNVLPAVGAGRLLAPDLIGMGASGKPDIAYSFHDHARYLDAWFDALELEDVILIGHDWGGALAFDWAARHPQRVAGVAVMESIIRPMSWTEFPAPARARYQALRTAGIGEKLALHDNVILQSMNTLTPLSDADMQAYHAPYPTPESRRPLLAWTRAIPFDGEPADIAHRLDAYGHWLATCTRTPKLLLTFDGAQLIGPDMVAWCGEHIANLETQNCGPAGHHAPEDRPHEIAAAISAWADRHQLRG
jgi:haloalkane dehalogenase